MGQRGSDNLLNNLLTHSFWKKDIYVTILMRISGRESVAPYWAPPSLHVRLILWILSRYSPFKIARALLCY